MNLTLFYSNEILLKSGKRMVGLLHPEMFMVFGVGLFPFIVLDEFTFNFLQSWFPCVSISDSKLTSIYWELRR